MSLKFDYPIAYISDCRDENTKGRLSTRVASYFTGNITFVGVNNEYEASLNLVDVIDAYDGEKGLIFANVAPRHGKAKRWENGTPFGHLRFENLDIFTTIDGYVLSLLQKLSGQKLEIAVYDIPHTIEKMDLSEKLREQIRKTQFRSFEYLPRLAREIMHGKALPKKIFAEVPTMPKAMCWVDCFGNIKTSLLPEEVGFATGKIVDLKFGGKKVSLPCYERLKDIPDDEVGLTIGSSGLGEKRLLEIMAQGGSASHKLDAKSGLEIEQ